jgi:HJR/Mrr/RecB family endonuclease
MGFSVSTSKRKRAQSHSNVFSAEAWYIPQPVLILCATILALIFIQESFASGNRYGILISSVGLSLAGSLAAYRIRKWWLRRRWLEGIEMQTIDRMTGREFEEFAAELFRRAGYRTKITPQTRDQGADLLLDGKNGRVVVQTKRQEGTVGNSAVQEVFAAKGFYNAQRAMVLTNSTYSASAIQLAKANEVELLGRHDLAVLIARVTRRTLPDS